jgi:hypothetical protein
MLMTPWLSAGVGIVVAAGLALNLPHAVLTYSPNYPGTKCRVHACGAVGSHHAPSGLAATNPGVKLRHARHAHPGQPAGSAGLPPAVPAVAPGRGPAAPAPARHRAPHRSIAVEVQYQTLQRWPSGFTALITITSQQDLAGWRLSFGYPGVYIDSVTGAKWQARSNGDGGVATPVPQPWGGQAGNQIRIMIIANGPAGQPADCRFDGAPCSFGSSDGDSTSDGGS